MFNQGIYSKSSTGGSSGQGITGVVANYSALPAAAAAVDEFYFVESPQGTAWLPGSIGGTYYPAGLYYSNGVTWFYAESPYQATLATVNTGTNTDQFVSPYTLANATTVERPLTFGTGLTRTVNTITANISTGIAGGQTIYGGTAASENLTISSTTHGTKGKVIFGSATGLVFNQNLNAVSIGNDSQQIVIAGTTYTIGISIHNDVGTFINSENHAASNTVSVGAVSIGTRSRGTYSVPTVVASGDNIWDMYSLGYDGTDYAIATGIEHEVDGIVAANTVPGRIVFKTATASGVLTESFRVNSSQGVVLTNLAASQILATDANKVIQTLTTATYPNLSELSFVKGLTSSAQNQIDSKRSNTTEMLLFVGSFPATNLAASTTYYWSNMNGLSATGTQSFSKFSFANNYTVTKVVLICSHNINPSSGNTALYIRESATTDKTITTTLDLNTVGTNTSKVFVYSGLGLSVTAGLDYELKTVTPAMGTTPTNCRWHIQLWGY